MAGPPPLKPEPEKPEPNPAPPRRKGPALGKLMEFVAESGLDDYLVAIATGVRTFRDLRRKKQDGEELK